MRTTLSTLLAVAATVPSAFAHYNFEALIVNGNQTEPYEFVRQTTNANSPITDVTSDDIICNAGGIDADIMAKTSTHSVAPGDQVGFTVNSELGHPGPLAVYMSRATGGDVGAYKGEGEWFKVYELTTSAITDEGLQWATYPGNAGIKNFTFALPEALPAGQYLMRAEHIALHGAGEKGGAQFYIGCAQLEVTAGSGAGGTPGPTVGFPGAYTGEEPGILIGIYWPVPTNYTAPGPAAWPGACEDHTANLDGQASDGDCTGSESGSGSGSSASSSSSSSAAAAASTPASSVVAPVAGASSSASSSSSIAAVEEPAATSVAVEAPAATSSAAVEDPAASSAAAPAQTSAVKCDGSVSRRRRRSSSSSV